MESPHSDSTACVILLSGGIDSAACVDFYQRQGFDVRGFHVSYGQAAAQEEQVAASAVAGHFAVPLQVVTVGDARSKLHGEIIGRNAFLLFTAIMEYTGSHAVFALGIHSGTPYYDCSGRFISALQAMVDAYTDGCLRVAAPFLEWTKQDVWRYCADYGVPVELTYSCEKGLSQPCGECLSCRDLEALRAITNHDASA